MDEERGATKISRARSEGCQEVPPQATAHLPQVNIRKVSNGFVLSIGCSEFVARTWTEASNGLAEYWLDPVGAQRKYTN